MRCNINGKLYLAQSTLLADILNDWGAKAPFVVAINHQFIPSEKHATTSVNENDNIDILSPIQGG